MIVVLGTGLSFASIVSYSVLTNILSKRLGARIIDEGAKFHDPFSAGIAGGYPQMIMKTTHNEVGSNLVWFLVILTISITIIGGIITYLATKRTIKRVEIEHNKMKQFIEDASHDLKTPLAIIGTYKESYSKGSIDADKAFKGVQAGYEKMKGLIDNMFLLARSSGEPNPLNSIASKPKAGAKPNLTNSTSLASSANPTDSTKSISDPTGPDGHSVADSANTNPAADSTSVSTANPAANPTALASDDKSQKGLLKTLENELMHYEDRGDVKVKWKIDKSIKSLATSISLNEVQLQRIFSNIIENAVKYGKSKGKPYTELLIKVKRDNRFYNIQFIDNGQGVERDKLKKIFDRFVRLDSSRTNNGNGLGLAIVRKIVTNANGLVKVGTRTDKDYNGLKITLSIM
jgi:signal transduction histidine kinase